MVRAILALSVALGLFVSLVNRNCAAADPPEPAEPQVAAASDEGKIALQGIRTDADLTGNLFAAEPLVANPVAFFVDHYGRVFVCETFRQMNAVTDNRQHDDEWLDADLAAKTVEDRRAYHLKLLGPGAEGYMKQDDRIRLLLDTNDDGRADEAHVFANRFNDLVDGTAAGVLEHNGNVYFTNIPNLWRLQDTDGDNQADVREIMHTGYGVRVSYRGHDMHGLRLGPDGRLYFSIGDRGANVDTPQGPLVNYGSGAVFRCELDGSNLELFATGLRNPQELAFDDYGNLFTGDNNSDSGDRARWVYVVEGGDSGWRMPYQYLPDRGPFNRERIWEPYHEGQPAYIVPPVANISDGPSGLDYYPGTGFGESFKGRFFLCDFRGSISQSGVRSLRVEPDGAFFRLVDDEQPIWQVLASDVQFGPDGGLYISDWVEGWVGVGKGRIYRFISQEHHDDPIVAEVRSLLSESFQDSGTSRLVELLGHADQRVRQKAQYELAARQSLEALSEVANDNGSELLARLHALWGLDQVSRAEPASEDGIRTLLVGLLEDKELEVRAHATRLLGEIGGDNLTQPVLARLKDDSLRVRYFAAMSLGKLGDPAAIPAVVELLAENDNADPIVRHGGVMALARLGGDDSDGDDDGDQDLAELTTHESAAVRLAAVVALRRRSSPAVAGFLDDADPLVVVEAARAIHDVPIREAMPALARLIERDTDDDALLRRVLNANFRLGGPEQALALAAYAAREGAPTAMRLEALAMLGQWAEPNAKDRVLNMWRPLEPRDASIAADALRPVVASMHDSDGAIRLEVGRVAAELDIAEAAPVLATLATDSELEPQQRADALVALARMTGRNSLEQLQSAAADESPAVRATAIGLLARHDPSGAAPLVVRKAFDGETIERQAAIAGLGMLGTPEAEAALVRVMQELTAGTLPPELHLEAITAAESHSGGAVAALLEQHNATRDPEKRIDAYREALYGGDAARGRTIFFEKTSVSCLRCHRVQRQGGEVGPELTRIATDKNREYLLEAIVDPNKVIAEGFASVMIFDADGRTHVGVLKEETEQHISIMDAEARLITIPKEDVDDQRPSKSAMPEDVMQHLTKAELRDLVAYLASLEGRQGFGGRRGFRRGGPRGRRAGRGLRRGGRQGATQESEEE